MRDSSGMEIRDQGREKSVVLYPVWHKCLQNFYRGRYLLDLAEHWKASKENYGLMVAGIDKVLTRLRITQTKTQARMRVGHFAGPILYTTRQPACRFEGVQNASSLVAIRKSFQ
jgi:hypothetical protein